MSELFIWTFPEKQDGQIIVIRNELLSLRQFTFNQNTF